MKLRTKAVTALRKNATYGDKFHRADAVMLCIATLAATLVFVIIVAIAVTGMITAGRYTIAALAIIAVIGSIIRSLVRDASRP